MSDNYITGVEDACDKISYSISHTLFAHSKLSEKQINKIICLTRDKVYETEKYLKNKHNFNLLKEKWEKDTKFLSDSSKIIEHPAYQKIIKMGDDAVIFIINDMKHMRLNHWFDALRQITNENPIKEKKYRKYESYDHWLARLV